MFGKEVTGNTGVRNWRIGFASVADAGGSGGILVGQWHQGIHVVDGEEAGVSVQHPLVPVVIDLIGEGDDIAFLEA